MCLEFLTSLDFLKVKITTERRRKYSPQLIIHCRAVTTWKKRRWIDEYMH